MKTVCKKLLCLMLVAMMLISAVPFAFADDDVVTEEPVTVHVAVTLDGEVINDNKSLTVNPGQSLVLDEATAMAQIRDKEGREFASWTNSNDETVTGNALPYEWVKEQENYSLTINLVSAEEETEPEVTTYILTFYYLDAEGNPVGVEAEIENNEKISLPTIPLVNGKDFLYWKDGKGNQVDANTVWNIGESQNITAVYESNTTADGLVSLTVYVSYYVDGKWHHEAKLYTEMFEKTNKNTMFEWLYSDAGKKQTRDALEAKGYFGYDWSQVKYYDYYDDGEVTKADLKSDGNKTVYVKVYSTDEIEANVMLYVHTKETATVDRVIPMPGYTEGDYVTYADVKAAVKTKYSGSNMTISDLYTKGDWEDLLDDIKSSGSRSIKVEDNGTTEIHVIVKNATSGSSNADSSNPKTGDTIAVAATTMVLAAAALVSVLELKKRKMI